MVQGISRKPCFRIPQQPEDNPTGERLAKILIRYTKFTIRLGWDFYQICKLPNFLRNDKNDYYRNKVFKENNILQLSFFKGVDVSLLVNNKT